MGKFLEFNLITIYDQYIYYSYNLRKKSDMKSASRLNDVSTVGVFLITLINVFISTFNGSNLNSDDFTNNGTTTNPNNC